MPGTTDGDVFAASGARAEMESEMKPLKKVATFRLLVTATCKNDMIEVLQNFEGTSNICSSSGLKTTSLILFAG